MLRNVCSITQLISEVNSFSRYTGLTLNVDKSEIYAIQRNSNESFAKVPFRLQPASFKILGITLGRDNTTKTESNVSNKLVSMQKCLVRWSQRNLSLLGKILVTKTHAVAKLVHTMTIINMSKAQIHDIQKTLNRFIWSNKPARVKHSVLASSFEEGGLNSLDVECQYKALRIPWIWRILRSANWNAVINNKLKPLGGANLLIQCNYDKNTLRLLPKFYKEIFIFWQEIVSHLGWDEMIVWNNKEIKVSNKTVFVEELFRHNVVYIHDFFQNDIFLTYDNFCLKYSVKISFRLYQNIVKAIQRYINRDPNIEAKLNLPKPRYCATKTYFRLWSGKYVDLKKAKSKQFYQEFLLDKTGFASALTHWQQSQNLREEIFYNSLPRTINATNETKLLAFQFKVIHNIINNNSNLYKWKIKDTDTCTYCNEQAPDNVVHEFTGCSWSRRVIVQIARELNLLSEFKKITKTEFIFGVNDPSINNIILIIKQKIHMVRQNETTFTRT